MRRYNLVVIRISETHLIKVDQEMIDPKLMLLYLGHEGENAQGVVLMPFKEAYSEPMGWESHGSGIIIASSKIKK